MPRNRKYTKELLAPLVAESRSYAEVARKLGACTTSGGTASLLKKRVQEYSLDVSHFTGRGWMAGEKPPNFGKRIPLEDVLVKDSTYSRSHLKTRLLSASYLKNVCSLCGLDSWKGEPLVMVLDHINGVGNDNRLENLRMLCPNCNSQQPTFCRRKT